MTLQALRSRPVLLLCDQDLLPALERSAVLAGVKAKPYGWPTASLDPSSGRRRSGSRREQAGIQDQQIPGDVGEVCRGVGWVVRCRI
jgi:hypothetical protein